LKGDEKGIGRLATNPKTELIDSNDGRGPRSKQCQGINSQKVETQCAATHPHTHAFYAGYMGSDAATKASFWSRDSQDVVCLVQSRIVNSQRGNWKRRECP